MGFLDGMTRCKVCGRPWAKVACGMCGPCMRTVRGHPIDDDAKQMMENLKKYKGVR
jgi:hypothetical protein